MEPADLKSIPPDDAQLEAWYRANVSAASLPDDGFSRRVLAALPPSAKRAGAKRRLFCLVGALTGTAFALLGSLRLGSVPIDPVARNAVLAAVLAQLATPAVGWALGITVVSLWFAFRRELRPLLRI